MKAFGAEPAVAQPARHDPFLVVQAVFGEILEVAKSGRLQWSEVLDRALEAFAQLHASEPAPRAVFANLQLYGEYADADQ